MKLAGFILLLFVFQNVCLDAQWNMRSTSQQNEIHRYAARSSPDDWNRYQLRNYGYHERRPMHDESLTKPQVSGRKNKYEKYEKTGTNKEDFNTSPQKLDARKRRNTQSNRNEAQWSVATNPVWNNVQSWGQEKPKESENVQMDSNLSPIPTSQLPESNLNLNKESITNHNKLAQTMTTTVLNSKNNFNLFSPIGLYSALGMLYLMANNRSESKNEINTLLGSNDKSLTAELMYEWSEYWIKKNDLVFANVFMRPKTFSSLEGTTLEEILKKSNTTLLGSQTDLNTFVDKVTQGQIKEIPIKEKGNTQVFVNIMMLRFTWPKKPRISSPKKFTYYDKKGNPVEKKIQYMLHSLPTKFSFENEYKACILPLATKEGGSIAPLAAYIFSFYDPDKEVQLGTEWTVIYEDLKQQKESSLNIFIPNVKLEQEIEFTKVLFPKLLRKNNKDFNPIVASNDVTIFLSQINKFCMDKDGVSAVSATRSLLSTKNLPSEMIFNKPFYIVLANPDTGVAVFSAKVAEGLDSKYSSCS
ncbi:hypothetical protein HMI54_011427 [Coelomomyces lativittatus]|nr:hypothetical protein HMI54_011427 [Coelomomyces lativittatus]